MVAAERIICLGTVRNWLRIPPRKSTIFKEARIRIVRLFFLVEAIVHFG